MKADIIRARGILSTKAATLGLARLRNDIQRRFFRFNWTYEQKCEEIAAENVYIIARNFTLLTE
ncbi:MAG: hypothetical protein CMI04_17525 [Oceanospirillaceae bacterium]|nr:hypothetical protein [Oceanospirillaceae bacterium]